MNNIKVTIDETPQLNVIDANDGGSIKITGFEDKKSVNFGPGAEMLMNPNKQKRVGSPTSEIKLADLTELDSMDLNEPRRDSIKNARNNFLFSGNDFAKKDGINTDTTRLSANIPAPLSSPSTGGLFGATIPNPILPNASESNTSTKTDDGFKKFNNIPVNPTINFPAKPKLSGEELLKEKFSYLRKLEALEKRGITLSKKYTMESSLDEMKGEYEMIKAEKEKNASQKFQGKMLMACVSGLEFLNNRFDPFDIKLDGWSEQINENLEEYDEIFGELHEKYQSKAKIAPELKLLFMLGGSAVMVHMTNTMFKSAMPGMDDILKQNPELMQQFTQAAVNTMGDENPGFANFVNGAMHRDPPMGSPPGPPEEYRRQPPKMNNRKGGRPDVGMSRGNPDFVDAENMESSYQQIPKTKRPEMRGPNDLRDILAGLKTKKINIKEEKANSIASVHEILELNKTDLSKPKKSGRRKKSDKNTVHLSI
jgi:hypothetical protein